MGQSHRTAKKQTAAVLHRPSWGVETSVCHPLHEARTTSNQHQTQTGGERKVMGPFDVETEAECHLSKLCAAMGLPR